jgi:hypothetical protein
MRDLIGQKWSQLRSASVRSAAVRPISQVVTPEQLERRCTLLLVRSCCYHEWLPLVCRPPAIIRRPHSCMVCPLVLSG